MMSIRCREHILQISISRYIEGLCTIQKQGVYTSGGRSFNLKHTISNHLLYLNINTKTENNMMIIYSKILNNRKRKKNTS